MQYHQNIQSNRIFTDENLAEKIIKNKFLFIDEWYSATIRRTNYSQTLIWTVILIFINQTK